MRNGQMDLSRIGKEIAIICHCSFHGIFLIQLEVSIV